jgi:molybdopterin-containing oxidoreductase family membrane subunit
MGGLLVLIAAGVATWVYQMNAGLQVTGMSNPVSWGLYIITFAFLVGLSAGGLIVTALAYILKNERLEAIAPLGVVVAIACVVGAMVMIIPDVGLPWRIVNILTSGNFTSPLFWDIFILITYLVIGVVEAWVLFSKGWRAQPERRARILRNMAYVILPVAILVHSVTAWIFGLQVGRPFWFTGLMAPIFISSALVSGLALLMLVMMVVQKTGKMKIDDSYYPFLGGMLAAFIAVDLFFLFSDLATVAYAGGTDAAGVVSSLLVGKFAPILWLEIVLGMIVPFVLLVLPATRSSKTWVGVASVLAIVAVFLKRLNIILPAFENINVDWAPGVSLGRYVPYASPFTTTPTYLPTWPEIVTTVGVLAGVLFLITLGIQLIASTKQKGEQVTA